jgi:hypothetical protein
MPRQAYYAARAIDERRQSQSAADARTAAVHAELSAHYEALAANPNLEPPAADQPIGDRLGGEAPTVWNPRD